MEVEERKMLENFDILIRRKVELKELTELNAWETLLRGLSEMRVDAMSRAIEEGDTTDQKAYARAFCDVMTFFHSLKDDTMIEDLIQKREMLKSEIETIEEERQEQSMSIDSSI